MPDLFLEVRDRDDGSGQTPAPLPEDEALALLATAEISASKLIPWGSNYSFAVALEADDGKSQLAIYKPRSGEAPLYDFPEGTLYRREYAAYAFSKLAGWDFIPPTVIRDGPHGIGSVQLYIQPDDGRGDDRRFWGSTRLDIERMVLFDHITNNADRKIGHCLRDRAGKVWGIDHGLTFNRYPKLRTVLWQYVGEPVSPALMDDLRKLKGREAKARRALAPQLNRSNLHAFFASINTSQAPGETPFHSPRRNIL